QQSIASKIVCNIRITNSLRDPIANYIANSNVYNDEGQGHRHGATVPSGLSDGQESADSPEGT
ncbi:MAG: hypothetical protein AAF802_14190, partial [Planctomycetota bacterium]